MEYHFIYDVSYNVKKMYTFYTMTATASTTGLYCRHQHFFFSTIFIEALQRSHIFPYRNTIILKTKRGTSPFGDFLQKTNSHNTKKA